MFLESSTLHGKNQRMWLNKFKIALSQKDTDTIENLLDNVPKFSNKAEMDQAMYLMKEGLEMLYSLQDKVGTSMKQIKKNIKFLQSSLSDSRGGFSIKS